jgi:hypothetical protein
MEVREWRAIGLGWAAAIAMTPPFGIGWHLPVAAILTSIIVYSFWR